MFSNALALNRPEMRKLSDFVRCKSETFESALTSLIPPLSSNRRLSVNFFELDDEEDGVRTLTYFSNALNSQKQ